jgi:hypothetical protein
MTGILRGKKGWQGYKEERRAAQGYSEGKKAGRDTGRNEELAGIQGGKKGWQGYREKRRACRHKGRKEELTGI